MKYKDWRIEDVSERELEKLAAWISLSLHQGDILLLRGDLGAGKTTFARALISHMSSGSIGEIPSPTFSLVQKYETARTDIFHFDLYRLNDADAADELGLEDAIAHGVSIIEWPERLNAPPSASHLNIVLEDAAKGEDRNLTITGHDEWSERLDRLEKKVRFVEKSGWNAVAPAYMQGDASVRAYARVSDGARPAILMDAPAQPDGPPVRDGLPYSRIARLSEDVRAFVAIASALRQAGFAAPEIYARDLGEGFIILEDLGDRTFGDEIGAGRPETDLYGAAVDVLIEMRKLEPPGELPIAGDQAYRLPTLDLGVFLIEAELLIDWYWPSIKGGPPPADVGAEFTNLYSGLFTKIDGRDQGWLLRDFHSPNLIWVDGETDKSDVGRIKHVGIIDFQDALIGPRSYDLVSLLQDARLDISEELEEELLNDYCARAHKQAEPFDEDGFHMSYAIMGAQRNTKILGIFARLAMRDNKRAYLKHMPRIWKYLERDLNHPQLADLKFWFDRHFPQDLRYREPDLAVKA